MISFIGDALIVAGIWAVMGQYPKIDTMPLPLYTKLQMINPLFALLLPIGIILALIGRALFIMEARHKIRAFFASLFLIGRLPFFEGLYCIGAFMLLYQELSAAEATNMLIWIAITISIGICFMFIAHKINSYQ